MSEGKKRIEEFVNEYNNKRLHSSICYVTPRDKLLGTDVEIFANRDKRLAEAREKRAASRKDLKNPEEKPSTRSSNLIRSY